MKKMHTVPIGGESTVNIIRDETETCVVFCIRDWEVVYLFARQAGFLGNQLVVGVYLASGFGTNARLHCDRFTVDGVDWNTVPDSISSWAESVPEVTLYRWYLQSESHGVEPVIDSLRDHLRNRAGKSPVPPKRK